MVGPYRSGNVSSNMFDLGYFDDYVGTVLIYRYDDNGVISYQTRLKNAFPLAIGNGNLSWDDNGFATISVRFYFQYYIDELGLVSGPSSVSNI